VHTADMYIHHTHTHTHTHTHVYIVHIYICFISGGLPPESTWAAVIQDRLLDYDTRDSAQVWCMRLLWTMPTYWSTRVCASK
jgi:hypothetical protein